MLRPMLRTLTLSLALGLAACAPVLGDACESATDCSPSGDRACDREQPDGYCTIGDCRAGDCGDEGVCVEFNYREPRIASRWCMANCNSNSDCRGGYRCVSAGTLNNERCQGDDECFAETLPPGSNRFCVAKDN